MMRYERLHIDVWAQQRCGQPRYLARENNMLGLLSGLLRVRRRWYGLSILASFYRRLGTVSGLFRLLFCIVRLLALDQAS